VVETQLCLFLFNFVYIQCVLFLCVSITAVDCLVPCLECKM
jgi:hypothetical protein